MRKCKGFYYKDGSRIPFEQGLFHQWGCTYEEFEAGPGNYSVAIVELPDGTIIMPYPTDLQFLPEQEERRDVDGTVPLTDDNKELEDQI